MWITNETVAGRCGQAANGDNHYPCTKEDVIKRCSDNTEERWKKRR